jgi:hypothetical protein
MPGCEAIHHESVQHHPKPNAIYPAVSDAKLTNRSVAINNCKVPNE